MYRYFLEKWNIFNHLSLYWTSFEFTYIYSFRFEHCEMVAGSRHVPLRCKFMHMSTLACNKWMLFVQAPLLQDDEAAQQYFYLFKCTSPEREAVSFSTAMKCWPQQLPNLFLTCCAFTNLGTVYVLKIENVKEREVKFDGYEGRIGWNVHWQEGLKWMREGDIHISVLREAQKHPTCSQEKRICRKCSWIALQSTEILLK